MKRVLIVLLCCLLLSIDVLAQKGMQSIGMNIPVGFRRNNIWTGIGIKYQYNFSDYFRMEADISYTPINNAGSYSIVLRGESTGVGKVEYAYIDYAAMLNAHVFLCAPRPFRPFVIAGFGLMDWKDKLIEGTFAPLEHPYISSKNSYSLNAGIGLDWRITNHFSMQFSVLGVTHFFSGNNNAPSIKNRDFSLKASVGVGYNF